MNKMDKMAEKFMELYGTDELKTFLKNIDSVVDNITANDLTYWSLHINIPVKEFVNIEPYGSIKGLCLTYDPERNMLGAWLTYDLERPMVGLDAVNISIHDSIDDIIEKCTISAKTCLGCKKEFNLNQIYVYITGHCCLDCARKAYPIPYDWKARVEMEN